MKLRLLLAVAIVLFYIFAYKLPDNTVTLLIVPILFTETLLYKSFNRKKPASLIMPMLGWNILYVISAITGLVIGWFLFGSLDFT